MKRRASQDFEQSKKPQKRRRLDDDGEDKEQVSQADGMPGKDDSQSNGPGREYIEKLMPQMSELSASALKGFHFEHRPQKKSGSASSRGGFQPIVLYNDDETIETQFTIATHIQNADCAVSDIRAICVEIGGYAVTDTHFSTEQFVKLLCIESNLKVPALSSLNRMVERINVKGDDDFDLRAFLLNEDVMTWMDNFRVALTVDNAKQKMERHQRGEARDWEWVAFMNEHFSDCCVIRVPVDVEYICNRETSSYVLDDCCHADFIVGRTEAGHLAGFYSWFSVQYITTDDLRGCRQQ